MTGFDKITDEHKKHNDAFNSMPDEYRHIAIKAELVSKIKDLERLKLRIGDNYKREINYINEKINHLNKELKQP